MSLVVVSYRPSSRSATIGTGAGATTGTGAGATTGTGTGTVK
jgi:hypothetical protein